MMQLLVGFLTNNRFLNQIATVPVLSACGPGRAPNAYGADLCSAREKTPLNLARKLHAADEREKVSALH
eukprot:7696435-Pyramimonas_sp.AAC.1